MSGFVVSSSVIGPVKPETGSSRYALGGCPGSAPVNATLLPSRDQDVCALSIRTRPRSKPASFAGFCWVQNDAAWIGRNEGKYPFAVRRYTCRISVAKKDGLGCVVSDDVGLVVLSASRAAIYQGRNVAIVGDAVHTCMLVGDIHDVDTLRIPAAHADFRTIVHVRQKHALVVANAGSDNSATLERIVRTRPERLTAHKESGLGPPVGGEPFVVHWRPSQPMHPGRFLCEARDLIIHVNNRHVSAVVAQEVVFQKRNGIPRGRDARTVSPTGSKSTLPMGNSSVSTASSQRTIARFCRLRQRLRRTHPPLKHGAHRLLEARRPECLWSSSRRSYAVPARLPFPHGRKCPRCRLTAIPCVSRIVHQVESGTFPAVCRRRQHHKPRSRRRA